jgi:hypothetical protein
MRTIVCVHCGRRVKANRKLKHLVQRYCGRKECQWQRKLNFERKKYLNDPCYRSRKLSKVRERKKVKSIQGNPQYYSDYQRAYRASHPEYVLQNRLQQRVRYARQSGKRSQETKIVNPDTLMLQQADNEHVYAMFAIDHKKIVNPDTLMLEPNERLLFTDKKPLFVRLL